MHRLFVIELLLLYFVLSLTTTQISICRVLTSISVSECLIAEAKKLAKDNVPPARVPALSLSYTFDSVKVVI